MANSGLFGPVALTRSDIDAKVGVGPGVYALGHLTNENVFAISYVGRSDDNLNGRLKDHIGNYRSFKYGHYQSAKLAFDKECGLFHDFGETSLDNQIHPARPQGTDWKCPRCGR